MSWEQIMQHIVNVESENADLQRQLAEAKDYIEHLEDSRI